jgi:hypothetical protein
MFKPVRGAEKSIISTRKFQIPDFKFEISDLTARRRCAGTLARAAAIAALGAIPGMAMASKPAMPLSPPASPPAIPSAVKVNGNQLFSWYETGTPAPLDSAYVGVPFLNDTTAATVNGYLASLGGDSNIRAVKVVGPISDSTAGLIFNNTTYHVSYVFGDLEGDTPNKGIAAPMAATLVNQVQYGNSAGSGALTKSSKAFVGNFGFSTISSNREMPTYYGFNGQKSFSNYPDNIYTPSRLNLSTEECYPGSQSFRNVAAGDSPQGSGSYPNIRGSLFVLPLWRVGQATDNMQETGRFGQHQNVPYTANFNNWLNLGLDNNRNASDGYKFEPGVAMQAATVGGHVYPAMTAAQTANQMLSERDFATMAMHMRMRGADSVHLLDSGAVGVSRDDMQTDARKGWLGQTGLGDSFGSIFSPTTTDRKLLIGLESIPNNYYDSGNYSGGSVVWVDGKQKNVDQTACAFSGAYSLSLGKLDVLISNMDGDQESTNLDGTGTDTAHSHLISLPSSIGGYALDVKNFTVNGGTHLLVEYSLNSKKGWTVALQNVPFQAIDNSRHHFGIPEPGTLSILTVAGIVALNRRRPRTGNAHA